MGEADSIAVQLSVTYLLYTVQDPFSATRQSSFQNNSLSSLCFLVDQVLASQIKTEEETLRVKLTPLWFSCQSPISCTQIKIHSAQQDSPVSQTVFTLFLFFWWTRSQRLRSRIRKYFTGEADSIAGQLSVTHLLYTIQDLFSAIRQSSFQNNFHSLLFVFWWIRSQHHRSRLRKRLSG